MEDKKVKVIGMGVPPVSSDNDWIKVERPPIVVEELREQQRRKNIKKGMKKSINKIGRPSQISEKMVERAFEQWSAGKLTQKEIAEAWGVSERTVRRKFKKFFEQSCEN